MDGLTALPAATEAAAKDQWMGFQRDHTIEWMRSSMSNVFLPRTDGATLLRPC